MKTTNYNIRLNPVIKEKAEKTFTEFGLNLSEAINVFLHTSIKYRGFPFEIREISTDIDAINANETLSDIYLNNDVTDENEIYVDYDNFKKEPALKSAIELAIENGQISTSILQTKLSLGYAKAARIINIMEMMKIIGPLSVRSQRKTLITREEFDEMIMNIEEKD